MLYQSRTANGIGLMKTLSFPLCARFIVSKLNEDLFSLFDFPSLVVYLELSSNLWIESAEPMLSFRMMRAFQFSCISLYVSVYMI